MTEQEYLSTIQSIRMCIENNEIEPLRHIFPKRLPYICAEVALMLAKGENVEKCRAMIDYVVQEFYPQEGLAGIFALKRSTYKENSPEWRQLAFLSEFYRTRKLPAEPFFILENMVQRCSGNEEDMDALRILAEQYFVTRNTLLSAILMMAWCKQTNHTENYEEYILRDAGHPNPHSAHIGNLGYLAQMLMADDAAAFLVIDDAEGLHTDIDMLVFALELLGHNVILLRESDNIKETNDVDVYAQECVQEAEIAQQHIVITVQKCKTPIGMEMDATPAVVRLLSSSIEQEKPFIVFARDIRMAQLHERTALAGEIQRLSNRLPEQFSYGLSFAWAGNYLKYISHLYKESAKTLLSTDSSCDFSIVIPVRNSSDTLRHTLETCLLMDYDGTYEVVLSDNSDADCNTVYELYEELADTRIRYYRPPQPLSLDKSFEYAFLHARGAFIFSIGADDGVYPWALRYLRKALADHPAEPLFTWRRGLYTWPGFLPHGRNILDIRLYDTEDKAPYEMIGLYPTYHHLVEHIDDIFYDLPLFYINSGFRRSYLKTLFAETGRVLDGMSQDTYMGTANFFLRSHFVQIKAPLTIAGMSGHSVGAGTQHFDVDIAEAVQNIAISNSLNEQRAVYVMRDGEYRVPCVDTAPNVGFYFAAARLSEFGSIDVDMATFEDVYFEHCGNSIYITDLRFERFCGLLMYSASLGRTETYQRCRDFYLAACASPKLVDAPKLELFSDYRRGYYEGIKKLLVDPCQFNCHNIADAVRLSAHLLNL